jgi:uncharacterized protein (DUF362 family)
MLEKPAIKRLPGITRRDLLWCLAGGTALGLGGHYLIRNVRQQKADVFIAKAAHYGLALSAVITSGLNELGVDSREIRGKRILLKPNLVEVSPGHAHINTHPLVIRGAIEAFLRLGAAKVLVGEGPGHVTDTLMVVEETGLGEVLHEDRIPFVDLNYDSLFTLPNRTGFNARSLLVFPATLKKVDWIVSVAKMKTHHWAGVTLSMKNLFGVMPGSIYGWPKNVLHLAGISQSIVDINATLAPHFAIVDGITGMQGDGPIMGDPIDSGVLVMGRSLPAVDATCCRIMGIDPQRIDYLRVADNINGPIAARHIIQRGETIADAFTRYSLCDYIPAQKMLL